MILARVVAAWAAFRRVDVVYPERRAGRAERITRLIDRATGDAELTAVLAASSADERADARELLDLAAGLLLDRCDLIRLRIAFLVAAVDDDEAGL